MKTFRKFIVCVAALMLLAAGPAFAESPEDEAVRLLREFLQVDTINPPGNESRAVEFYGGIFAAEGIAWESAESAPGRGNIWARLKGGGKPALILIQHTDVVPADPEYWTTDPLGAEVKNGYLYGRGAVDMKGLGINQLAAFLSLHRAGRPLNRDVVFVATADEEAGGLFGAGWLIENHPEIFAGAGMLLNEGGAGTDYGDHVVFNVEVTQKVPVWLRLTVVDTPGHGSRPLPTSAVTKLIEGLERIRTNPFPARIIPAVDAYFRGLAQAFSGGDKAIYADMGKAIKKPGFLAELQLRSASHHALTRDTCSITRLGASNKINVVPPSAWAEIDCRMLPDRLAAEFIADVKALLQGLDMEVETILAFTPAVSPTDNDLYRAIENMVAANHPGATVVPGVSTGFTDSHFTRDLGIPSFGFSPLVATEAEFSRLHGNDERVILQDYRRSVGDLRAIINQVVYD